MPINRIHPTTTMGGNSQDPIRVSNTPDRVIYLWSSHGFSPAANYTVAAALYENGALIAGPVQISNGTVRCAEARGIIDSNGNLVVFYSYYIYSGGGANPFGVKYAVYSADLSTVIVPETIISQRPDEMFRPHLHLLSDGRIFFHWMRTRTGQTSSSKGLHGFILNSDYTTHTGVTELTGNTSGIGNFIFVEEDACIYTCVTGSNNTFIRKLPVNVNALGTTSTIALSNGTGILPSPYTQIMSSNVFGNEESPWNACLVGDFIYVALAAQASGQTYGNLIARIDRISGSYTYFIIDPQDISPGWDAMITAYTPTHDLTYVAYENKLYISISAFVNTSLLNYPAVLSMDLSNFGTYSWVDTSGLLPYLITGGTGAVDVCLRNTYNDDTGVFSSIWYGGTVQATTSTWGVFVGDNIIPAVDLPDPTPPPEESPDPAPDPVEDPTPPFPSNWLSDPTFEKCLVAKIKYFDTEEKTFYFSSHEHSSIADGLLRGFIPRLAKSPTFQMSVSTSDNGMSTSVNYGSLPILNSDGKFDDWMDYGFDGRDISLYVGPVLGNVDSDFVKVFEGVVDRVVFEDNSVITLTFRDYAKKLDKPIQDSNYVDAETITFTTDATKTVSVSSTLKGQPKPLVFGEVFNIEPVLVNASYLVYQVSDEPIDAIVAVYDKGILLTPGVGYRVDLSKGILELVNNPSGVITCDVRGVLLEDNYITPSTKSYSNKLVRIVKELCYRSGIPGSKLTSTDYVANVPVGIYLKERVNALNVIDELLNSIDGFMYFDPVGSLVISTLVVPNNAIGSQIGRTTSGLSYGDIVYDQDIDADAYIIASDTIVEETIDYSLSTLSEKHLLVKSRLPFVIGSSEITGALSVRSLNVPSFRTKVGYKKNYTVQSDLAAATVSATREFMASEFRSVVAEDLTISSKFLSSIERAQLDGLVTTETNASGINKGLLARYGRQIYSMEFTMLLTDIVKAKLGDPVQVTDYRFNMSGSRLGTISSIEVNYLDGIARVSADFYSYPYINQYFTYQLGSLIEDSIGTSSVVDYDVTIPASGYSIVNAAHYIGTRYFLISPDFTSTGDSVEIIWCKRDSSGLPDLTTSYSVKLVKAATPNELTVLTDGVATGTISLASIPETIQVVFDFDAHRAGLVAFESEDTGSSNYYGLACPAGDPSEYYCLAFKNLTPNDLVVSFADTSYYQPRGTRWLQIAKQEVPSYLVLDDLEFEDGTYLLV